MDWPRKCLVISLLLLATTGWRCTAEGHGQTQDIDLKSDGRMLQAGDGKNGAFDVLYSWVSLEFLWPNEALRQSYLSSGAYIPNNNALAGIAHHKGVTYVTVPRWKRGVPVTLARVVLAADGRPVLEAFPSWEMQDINDQDQLQFVQQIHVDSRGRMWILDSGHLYGFEGEQVPGRPELLIWDLENNKLLERYIFPESVAAPGAAWLNDMVLDEERDIAYIPDTGNEAGIIVYYHRLGTSRRLQSFRHDEPATAELVRHFDHIFNYRGERVMATTDGIALSNDRATLYFSPVAGVHMFSIPTSALWDPGFNHDVALSKIENLGFKAGISDGMMFTQSGTMYYGAWPHRVMMRWDPSKGPFTDAQEEAFTDGRLDWIDTMALDAEHRLWFTINKVVAFVTGTMDFSGDDGPNFYVCRTTFAP